MRPHYYLLEGKLVVPCDDVIRWGRMFGNFDNRRVAYTKLENDVSISTVFLGLDHNWMPDGPPLLFETMVFGGKLDQECERSSTWEEAETDHRLMVERVRAL